MSLNDDFVATVTKLRDETLRLRNETQKSLRLDVVRLRAGTDGLAEALSKTDAVDRFTKAASQMDAIQSDAIAKRLREFADLTNRIAECDTQLREATKDKG